MPTQKNTMKDMTQTVHQLQEQVCDKACDVKEDVQEVAHYASQKVREIYDTAIHQGRDATAAVEKQIRSHPLATSAIAAGIGFLLGALFRRRA